MTSVKRHRILINPTASTAYELTVPISMDFQPVDQYDVIKDKFIDVEVENSINPIVDYEKVRLSPIDKGTVKVGKVSYDLRFLNDLSNTNHWDDIVDENSNPVFTNEDIKFRKNRFKKSFLRLNFYDSDIPTDQRLLSFTTVFPELSSDYIHGVNATPPDLPSTPFDFDKIPIKFVLENPITKPKGFAEGYYLYHFKDEIPTELFMRAQFNCAADGKTYNFMTTNALLPIDQLVDNLHVKYILKKDNTGYYYTIDDTYSSNVTYSAGNTEVEVTLYEIQVS